MKSIPDAFPYLKNNRHTSSIRIALITSPLNRTQKLHRHNLYGHVTLKYNSGTSWSDHGSLHPDKGQDKLINTGPGGRYIKMINDLEHRPPGSPLSFEESSGEKWTPLFRRECSFPSEIFRQVMLNLIKNPNINSNHLFRADISMDAPFTNNFDADTEIPPRITNIIDYDLKTIMVRTMIPRNILVDKPLDQTCLFHEHITDSGEIRSLVTYLPHIASASEAPFYHPAVRGIGFLHTHDLETQESNVSIHYSFFESEPRSAKLERTAQHLLAVLHKHGQGVAAGYVKRVNHDSIFPQSIVQNTYARLKAKYAKTLINNWVEVTDPTKHVFEDLNIAAFLIELWKDMYKDVEFPGFVDIGCGNGLLVHILLEEGYEGWGFDARRRKSWITYSAKTQENLKELVLVPSIIRTKTKSADIPASLGVVLAPQAQEPAFPDIRMHDGVFPRGTFIISNHADELTPWTPILANISSSPFMMLPCCSHALSGSRFRASPPKGSITPISAYASLLIWVSNIARDCGWEVEKEMLRMPSTRNTALIGRRRKLSCEEVDAQKLITKYGGAAGWEENAQRLVKGLTRGH